MSDHVKNPKVPHQWGEVGQRFIQVEWDWILPEGRTIHNFKTTLFTASSLWETEPCIRNFLSTYIHTDTYLHIHRVKKGNSCIYLSQKMFTVLDMYLIIQRVDIPPSVFSLFAEGARSIPTSRCPKPPITSRQHVVWRFWADVNSHASNIRAKFTTA